MYCEISYHAMLKSIELWKYYIPLTILPLLITIGEQW
jgi:hypothetical protein